MQNKQVSLAVILLGLSFSVSVGAQEVALPVDENIEESNNVEASAPKNEVKAKSDPLADFSVDMSQKKSVDFPARSSLDTLEMAALPGIYETNITGPQPMEESVSINDTPSEQLLGRLTPEVFQEMAQLERDNAFLKLQIQKETMKNDLENLRAQYRQARLKEISDREDVIRTRIQWWQEQEKIRQEMEKERAEAEEVKNKMAEAEALKAQMAAEAAAAAAVAENEGNEEEVPEDDNLEPAVPEVVLYSLVDVKGTRGNLTARIKNIANDEITSVKVGDNLNGEVITSITSESVIVDRKGTEYVIKFPAN